MSQVASVLWYASWPSLTFVVLVLWAFGILDIARHRRRGTSTGAGLLCMAGCVSLVAVAAVAGVGAVFAEPWVETFATVGPAGGEAGEPARSPVFSFGLENASYAAVGPAGERGTGVIR
jgi:hypothetical protein